MPPPATPEPLRFERIALEKPWGGRALERTPGIALPGQGRVGETWELADRPGHSSVVAAGPLRGTSLCDLMRLYPAELLGASRASPRGGYPLLVKYLDASEALSLQVHPHERTRRADEEKKSECWYVLSAAPDACIWLGLEAGVSRADLAARAAQPGIAELVRRWPVQAGDFVLVPAGTVHAIGAGITLVEIQENADVTYRLYDWDRPGSDGRPRSLQVDDALRVARFDAPELAGPQRPRLRALAPGVSVAGLCAGEEFSVELCELEGACELDTSNRVLVTIVLAGSGRIRTPQADCELKQGDVWLVPAATGRHVIEPKERLKLLLARGT